jgi:hypothetical protein
MNTFWEIYGGFERSVIYEIIDFDVTCSDQLFIMDGDTNGPQLFKGCGTILTARVPHEKKQFLINLKNKHLPFLFVLLLGN